MQVKKKPTANAKKTNRSTPVQTRRKTRQRTCKQNKKGVVEQDSGDSSGSEYVPDKERKDAADAAAAAIVHGTGDRAATMPSETAPAIAATDKTADTTDDASADTVSKTADTADATADTTDDPTADTTDDANADTASKTAETADKTADTTNDATADTAAATANTADKTATTAEKTANTAGVRGATAATMPPETAPAASARVTNPTVTVTNAAAAAKAPQGQNMQARFVLTNVLLYLPIFTLFWTNNLPDLSDGKIYSPQDLMFWIKLRKRKGAPTNAHRLLKGLRGKGLHDALDFAIKCNKWPCMFKVGEQCYNMVTQFIITVWCYYVAHMASRPAVASRAAQKVTKLYLFLFIIIFVFVDNYICFDNAGLALHAQSTGTHGQSVACQDLQLLQCHTTQVGVR